MNYNKIRLFVDFDGTVTLKDVGDSIFETFLDPLLLRQGWHAAIIEEWKSGRLSSHECLTRECARTRVTKKELDRHLDAFTLTAGFIETIDYCRRNGIPLTILSDGLDYYIEYVLGKHGISDVRIIANHLVFDNGSLAVEFPYEAKGCGRCGNCKRWHLDTLAADGETIVYVSDGYSDRYAVRSADMLFARGDLIEYCGKYGIEFREYTDFFDIVRYLEHGSR